MQKLIEKFNNMGFIITPLSIIINPFYIIRSGLFKTVSEVAPKLKGDILDFGCGSKPYESLFNNAESYIGLDIEVSGHNHKDSRIDFFYDGKTLPFDANRFDCVVCFEVLEHVFNLEEILIELRRVLKPGGKLLISVPFAWDEHEIPYDFARYTSYGLSHILIKNGFQVEELKKTTTYFLAVTQMFIAYLYQHVLPKRGIANRLSQIFVIFPVTIICLFLNKILPKRYEYFCNCVVLANKLI